MPRDLTQYYIGGKVGDHNVMKRISKEKMDEYKNKGIKTGPMLAKKPKVKSPKKSPKKKSPKKSAGKSPKKKSPKKSAGKSPKKSPKKSAGKSPKKSAGKGKEKGIVHIRVQGLHRHKSKQ